MSIYIDSRCDRFSCWCQHRQGRDSAILSGPFSQRRFSDPSHRFWHKQTKYGLDACNYKGRHFKLSIGFVIPNLNDLLSSVAHKMCHLKDILAILCNIKKKKKKLYGFLKLKKLLSTLIMIASERVTGTLFVSLILCSIEESQCYRF